MCNVTKKPKDHTWLDASVYLKEILYVLFHFIYIWTQPIAVYFDRYCICILI